MADQIRELAEETKVSTEQITTIINELNMVTGETQKALQKSVESMSNELENIMDANKEIVSSISTLSAASEEVLAETQLSKDTINGTFNSMKVFSETVDGTFEQLQILKETVVTE